MRSPPSVRRSRPSWWAWLGAAALVGLAAFGIMIWQTISSERLEAPDAQRRFNEIRAAFRSAPPLVRRDESGQFVRTEESGRSGRRPTTLSVAAYDASLRRLITADVPIWFLRIKGPAAALALRGTDFDLAVLGLTAEDLAQSGAGLVLDEDRGDRHVLAWTH